MIRDDNDPGAATWGTPGAVTVGYIPEEKCRLPREEEESPKLGFKTSPEPAVKWNPITVATGAGE